MKATALEALHTWAEVFAAFGSTLTFLFLCWDRFRPRPLQIATRFEVRATVLPDAARVDVFLANDLAEPVVITAATAPMGFEIASAYNMTPAAMRTLRPENVKWTRRLRYRRQIAAGQAAEDSAVRLFIRPAETKRPLLLFWRSGPSKILIEGERPFSNRQRLRIMTGPRAKELGVQVTRNLNKREKKSAAPGI